MFYIHHWRKRRYIVFIRENYQSQIDYYSIIVCGGATCLVSIYKCSFLLSASGIRENLLPGCDWGKLKIAVMKIVCLALFAKCLASHNNARKRWEKTFLVYFTDIWKSNFCSWTTKYQKQFCFNLRRNFINNCTFIRRIKVTHCVNRIVVKYGWCTRLC